MEIQVKRISEFVNLPTYATTGAVGMDLRAATAKPMKIYPGVRKRIPTGIALCLPSDVEGQIRSRSGLAHTHGVVVANGVGTVDSDYRGPVSVILINLGEKDFTVYPGDRIAQIIFAKVIRADLILVEDLVETDRGENGFGSTGIK